MGGGVLVELSSSVVALRTCLSIQNAIVVRKADQPDASKLPFRIGIKLGAVFVDEDDILGDGVNIAARLESLAPPGGVYISRAVLTNSEGG